MLGFEHNQTTLRARIGALAGLLAIGALAATVFPAVAQSPPPPGIRLYVIDCGTSLKRDPALAGLPGKPADKPVPCFLIVHPKGTLLWENGLNDAQDDHPGGGMESSGPAIVTKSLKSQLIAIGHPPASITYIAVSHYHSDHAGNSNDYAGSTWITQKDMRDAMFGPWPGVLPKPLPNVDQFNALKNAKTIVIPNKDYDVFGDGSVIILYTPAVTPGHQSLFVRLPKTGPVVISGDLYTQRAARYLYLQLIGSKFPGKPYTNADLALYKSKTNDHTMASMAKMEDFLKKTGAKLWIQHDPQDYESLKKSPAYYE